jgi:hypothetical protein
MTMSSAGARRMRNATGSVHSIQSVSATSISANGRNKGGQPRLSGGIGISQAEMPSAWRASRRPEYWRKARGSPNPRSAITQSSSFVAIAP